MGLDPELAATLRGTIEATGLDGDAIAEHPGETIMPAREHAGPTPLAPVEDLLRHDTLEVHETLGEGGMGLVRLGVQTRRPTRCC